MKTPAVTAADWRAQVEKELAGAPFDKALVHTIAEGIAIQPLYAEAPPGFAEVPAVAVDPSAPPFLVCVRQGAGAGGEEAGESLQGGADALWLPVEDEGALRAALGGGGRRPFLVIDLGGGPSAVTPAAALERVARCAPLGEIEVALAADPLGAIARGATRADALPGAYAALVEGARALEEAPRGATSRPRATAVMISTLPYHDAGADAADELAIALATGAAYLEAMLDAGLAPGAAARRIAVQIAVGRDTFVELGKLRALRVVFQKLFAAVGAEGAPRALVHAVCSSRTLAQRDPWVNMLRATMQVFAAAIGGVDLVTPTAFDEGLGPPSALGRRLARNTGLVLRDESFLGKVADPAGGSYYVETLTDALAREGWRRFQAIEREGGMHEALASGRLRERLEGSWKTRLELIAKRRVPILGVSEFANLGETLPRAAEARAAQGAAATHGAEASAALPVHRESEAFERLRARAEAIRTPAALLVTLGTFAESRARAGFAAGFLAAGGIGSRETTRDEAAALACLCGTDERYAAEAAGRARALKAAGCRRVILAGRPGALEASLREAGVDGFIYVGCDAVATLADLLEVQP